MVGDVRGWPLTPVLPLCQAGGGGGVWMHLEQWGLSAQVGGTPEVLSHATLLDLEHPSPGALTCCVASGKVWLL